MAWGFLAEDYLWQTPGQHNTGVLLHRGASPLLWEATTCLAVGFSAQHWGAVYYAVDLGPRKKRGIVESSVLLYPPKYRVLTLGKDP